MTENLSSLKYKIVLVPFPFENFSGGKVRPALCLTESFGKFEHVVVAFISSKIESQLEETEIEINPLIKIWEDTGLLVQSVLKLHKLVSLPKTLILRELGEFPQDMRHDLEKRVRNIFGLK